MLEEVTMSDSTAVYAVLVFISPPISLWGMDVTSTEVVEGSLPVASVSGC